jgi:uncharacterized protein
MTDVIAAVRAGDVAAIERLVEQDPALAASTEEGISAVRIALYHRQPAALAALLAAGPPLDGFDHAALGRAEDLERDLAADPGLISAHAADGFAAIHLAAFLGGPDAVRVLLRAGASANEPAGGGLRPLHSAAAAQDAASVALLLAAGADPDAQQTGGFTALHAAAHHDDEATAEALLRAGADPAIRTDDGADAAGIARAARAGSVLALLGG